MSDALQRALAVVDVHRVDDAGSAEALFRSKFRDPPPNFPSHYVGTYGERVVGYVHMTALEDLRLAGGLCVDASLYRLMPVADLVSLREAGGIARMLMAVATADRGLANASFAYIGNPLSQQICRDVGYELASPPYIHAFWHVDDLPPAQRESILERVRALGPF
jgi:hypothetical protein